MPVMKKEIELDDGRKIRVRYKPPVCEKLEDNQYSG